MKKAKNKVKINRNQLEQLLGSSLDQIFGTIDSKEKQKKNQGELIEGKELSLKELQGENTKNEETRRETEAEIKKLADSSTELQMQFKEVAVEQYATKPGKYHKNFFSWLLSIIRNARMKVEDSGAWLAAMHSKKKSREYGAMAKKHGTSFTLNNERTVATQVG